MQIYTTIQKGEGHPVFCEDFLWTGHFENNWFIGAVMDGCSSGKDSHFASSVLGKILSKIVHSKSGLLNNDDNELHTLSTSDIGRKISESIFDQMKEINDYLRLDYTELLSTLILLVYQPNTKEAWILVSGDGYVAINEKVYEIDQNNRPDYMSYHFHRGFDIWFDSHVRFFHEKNAVKIGISTDGVGSFFSYSRMARTQINTVGELLTSQLLNRDDLLQKIKKFQTDQGIMPYDDVAIIRIENPQLV